MSPRIHVLRQVVVRVLRGGLSGDGRMEGRDETEATVGEVDGVIITADEGQSPCETRR